MTYTTHQRQLGAFLFLKDFEDNSFDANFGENFTPGEVESYLEQGVRLSESISELQTLLSVVDEDAEPVDVQTVFYDVGKKYYGTEKEVLREWFRHMYLVMFQKNDGARWGKFVDIVGMDTFLEMLEKYSNDPMRMNNG